MLVPRGNKPWHTLGEIESRGRGPGRWAVGGGGDGSSIGSQVIPGFDVIGAPVSRGPVTSTDSNTSSTQTFWLLLPLVRNGFKEKFIVQLCC